MRQADFPYLPKDFVETKEGLIFAVVSYHPHEGKVGGFLRYVPEGTKWQKVDTEQANRLLGRLYPQYLYKSRQFDTEFHAVALDDIAIHHRPEQRLQILLQNPPEDELEAKLHKLITILAQYGINCDFMGLTGSMLINQQHPQSDVDLVIYGRDAFHKTREAVGKALADGALQPLDQSLMWDNFERRASELSFEEFAWHESRKLNKAAVDGSKFDIGMVCLPDELKRDHHHYMKQGTKTVKATVIDDHQAFDFPARYIIDNKLTPEVVAYTHTYVGQAKTGEMIEISAVVECGGTGQCRLIVGSTREATGEYIKVCR